MAIATISPFTVAGSAGYLEEGTGFLPSTYDANTVISCDWPIRQFGAAAPEHPLPRGRHTRMGCDCSTEDRRDRRSGRLAQPHIEIEQRAHIKRLKQASVTGSAERWDVWR